MNLWREPIDFRKVSMAFSFYLIKYHLWPERCFVYSRYRENCYISDISKAPPTGREWMCIFNNAVFVQTNAKIHPPTMGHHCAAASITTKRNLKVDLGKCVQMYRAPFLYLPGAPNSLNPPLYIYIYIYIYIYTVQINAALPSRRWLF